MEGEEYETLFGTDESNEGKLLGIGVDLNYLNLKGVEEGRED